MPRKDWRRLVHEIRNDHDIYKKVHRTWKGHHCLASLDEQDDVDVPAVVNTFQIINEESARRPWHGASDRLDCTKWQRDPASCAALLRWCGEVKALTNGKQVHINLIKRGLELDSFVGSLLLQMYSNCGALEDARACFNKLHKRDQSLWNCLIRAYARHGHGKEALQLFFQMELEGNLAEKFVFATVLSACNSQAEGKQMHARIMSSVLAADLFTANALLTMHTKRSSLEDALRIFEKMLERDAVSWNIMIGGCSQQGQGSYGLQLFEQMQSEGVMPTKATFVSIVTACRTQTALSKGKRMHALIKGTGFGSDVGVGTALVEMYCSCSCLQDAQKIFETMPETNITAWNALISAYAQHGLICDAIQLFENIDDSLLPNRITFVGILSECASQAALEEGKHMHAQLVGTEFNQDVVFGNVLIKMYGNCGNLEDAHRIFDKMTERDTITWNAMIATYVQHRQGQDAFRVFEQMQVESLVPNHVTFISLISACATLETDVKGRLLHARVEGTKFAQDDVIRNALINMYGKCSSPEDAWRVFDQLFELDIFSWNAMISAYARHGQCKYALEFFNQMQSEGVMPDKVTFICMLSVFISQPSMAEGKKIHARITGSEELASDVVVQTTLVTMYGKCGSLEDSKRIFDKMPHQNAFSWNAMMAAYVQHGEDSNALQLYYEMQHKGRKQDKVTFLSILSACAGSAALAEGKHIHIYIVCSESGPDFMLGNALISMYGKCGSMADARRLFDQMPVQNAVSWSAMIAANAQHGLAKDSLLLIHQMQQRGVVPNSITFLSVLYACSHAGLVDEGYMLFSSMNLDYAIVPTVDHYNCLIDLFGRAGLLDEAEDVIKEMPTEPTVVSWTTLLGACRNLGDTERGEYAARQLFQVDPENAGSYITLSNLLSAAIQGDEVSVFIDLLRDKDLMAEQHGTLVPI